MSRMHRPESVKIPRHAGGGTKTATCPACDAEMNPAQLPNHIATAHGVAADE